MKRSYVLTFGLVSTLWASCGATLPKDVSRNRPVGVETALNLDEVKLTNLTDGSPVALGPYMREHNLQWLVLSFGSKSCGACMEKARYFQTNLVADYTVLGQSARGKIELRGVATDPQASRDELLALVADEKLTHLSWADDGDEKIMMKYFQPAGMSFSVPLTVMLSKDGILWRVSSKDKLSAPDIMRKISATIGSDAAPPADPESPQSPTPGPVSWPLLAREVPNRFDEVTIKACADGRGSSLGSELSIVDGGLRAVLVHKGACATSDSCIEAKQKLQEWKNSCDAAYSRSCVVKDLIMTGSTCDAGTDFIVGADLFDVFSDHFSWSYSPMSAGSGRIKLPESKGPLTLIFDSAGRLVYSREGAIAASLAQRMEQDGLSRRADGPDFNVHWEQTPAQGQRSVAATNFSSIRSSAKYTVMMFWNTWCSSCTEELQEWHQEDSSAYKFCQTHSDYCQVVALETGRSDSGLPAQDYLAGLIRGNDDFDGWIINNWTMSLAVEGEPHPDGRAPMGWYSGWLRAKFGSTEPRTVLYDREGKVLGQWRSLPGEHGPRDTLKKLFESGW